MSKKKDIATGMLGIAVGLILWLTILSREVLIGTPITYKPFHALMSFINDIQHGRFGANFLGNIALFVPVGFLFPMVTNKRKLFWTVGVGFVLSLSIEIIQLITARGCFDPDDVILNTIGTAIGYGLYCTFLHKKTVDTSD